MTAFSVHIGGYSLELGGGSESFAQFEATQEHENAEALHTALADAPDVVEEGAESERRTPVDVVEDAYDDASAFTDRVEQARARVEKAQQVYREVEGRLRDPGSHVDPANLEGEVMILLDAVDRLDRAGRFDEQLRLLRTLHGYYVLYRRWLELVRWLRSLLRTAKGTVEAAKEAVDAVQGAAGAAQRAGGAVRAWAHHELGSLHLCAGEPEKAREHLERALEIKESLGDVAGRCATRHNLDSARRDATVRRLRGGRPRRFLRFAWLALFLLLFLTDSPPASPSLS